MPRFSDCCEHCDMFICQVCGRDLCSGCQYGDRPDLTNITGFKGTGNVCKNCLRKLEFSGLLKSLPATDRVAEFMALGSPGTPKKASTKATGMVVENPSLSGPVNYNDPAEPDAFLNPLDYADDPAELELQTELRNQGIMNQPEPICCPRCSADLEIGKGMVGERIAVCPNDGIVWEDQEDAIRRVF